MIKKIFQAAFLPALVTAFFLATLLFSNLSGNLFFDEWVHRGVVVFLEILVWLSVGWLFNRLLSVLFWDALVGMYTEHHPPKMLVQISGIFVFFLTLSLIAHFVFDEPLTSILVTGGGLTIALGFGVQGLINDLFSSLAIQLDPPFKVGDFINVHHRYLAAEGLIGRVEETNWRTTRMWTTDRNYIVVPNSYITTQILTNYSMPKSLSRFELNYTLDFAIPSDRAIRIFNAALLDSVGPKGPVASPKPTTILTGINSDGAVYKLKYFLEPKQVSPPKARNTINANVLHHLANAGMSPSYDKQDLFIGKMPKRQKSWSDKEDRMDLLSNIALFKDFSGELLQAITESFHLKELKPEKVLFNQGDDGDSLFVLVEGLLEVSSQVEDEKRHLSFLRPGSFLGEMALLTGEKRSADVTSSTESLVGELTKESIMSLATENPEVLNKMTAVVAKRRLKNKEMWATSTKSHDEAVQQEEKSLMVRVINFFFGNK
ncbi:MAG: mechanosensitive ion channel family protein [Gammaproteobacteria bacterium]|nr:mechanosensitive ion channel family protein [Gammaproteobacteria bacterium]